MHAASIACLPAAPCRGAGLRPKPPTRAPRLQRSLSCTLAFRKSHSNGSSSPSSATLLKASPEQIQTTQMLNLTLEYFEELLSKGNVEVCSKILDPQVHHKDMVRNEGRQGIEDYKAFIHGLRIAYPNIWVRPTQFGVMDATTLFVAFEGRATSHTPLFKGIDLFRFNDSATKITEVEVYRSNWLGAQGHEERKKLAQRQQG